MPYLTKPITDVKPFFQQKKKIWAIVGGLLILIWVVITQIPPKKDTKQKSFLGQSDKPRGIRNNNPGNIRYSPLNNWDGKVPISQNTDGSFEQFVEFRYGVAALIKLLKKYIIRYGTIERMISVYAPSTENNTQAYIKSVVADTGFPSNQALTTTTETLRKLTLAIAKHETGSAEWVKNEDFNEAIKLV